MLKNRSILITWDTTESLGKVDYNLTNKQMKGRDFSRSLYIVENIKEGEIITTRNIRSVLPGFELYPQYYYEVLGKRVNKDVERGGRLD